MEAWAWLRAHRAAIAFGAILAVGLFLRLWQFPAVPVGMNQDEISAAYEAQSLLQTGADRWGYRWPAYFLSWGSGQNVLYSYLTIPVIAMLGHTTLAVRLVAVIFGIGTVPLMYAAVRPHAGVRGGLLAMGFVATAPWAFMTSRWGVESNIMPFWLLLGIVLVDRAMRRNKPLGIVLSLLPFAVALYAYGVAAIVLAVFLPLYAISHRADIRRHVGWWIASAAAALVVSIPFLLFFLKSEVLHRALPFESALPFSLPTLTITRLAQLGHGAPQINTGTLLGGLLYDNQPEDVVQSVPPLGGAIVVLALIGLAFAIRRAVQTRFRGVSPFALMLVASVPLFVVIPNIIDTRVNAIFLPLIALAATGLLEVADVIRSRGIRVLFVGVSLVGALAVSAYAATVYFSPAYTTYAEVEFYPGLGTAIKAAARISGSDELYLSNYPQLTYVQTLWYLDIPSRTFQKSHPTPRDPDFGRFVFSPKRIDKSVPYYFLISFAAQQPPCKSPHILWRKGDWAVGKCG